MQSWKILLIESDEAIRNSATELLNSIRVDGLPVKATVTPNPEEAILLLRSYCDFAVVIVDLNIQLEQEALELVRTIRGRLFNNRTRIIFCTHDPSYKPDKPLLHQLDVSEYRTKEDLLLEEELLQDCLVTNVRTFRNITKLEQTRNGLQSMIRAASSVFQLLNSMEQFSAGLALQLPEVLNCGRSGKLIESAALFMRDYTPESKIEIIGGIGDYESCAMGAISEDTIQKAENCLLNRTGIFIGSPQVFHFGNKTSGFALLIEGDLNITDGLHHELIEMFCNNISIAVSNIRSHQKTVDLNRAYRRFSGTDSLIYLGKKDILDVELGDSAESSVAILFLDIRSFVQLSSEMTRTDLFRFVNSFLAAVGPIINKNFGMVNKYLGDGLMAIFDRPGHQCDDAVDAAIKIIEATQAYNKEKRSGPVPEFRKGGTKRSPIELGIGINYGSVIVGTVGYSDRMEFTVLGDAVNTASRIEELTKTLNTNLLIHENVANELSDKPLRRQLPPLEIRGTSEKHTVWEVFQADDPALAQKKSENLELFKKAMELWASTDNSGVREKLLHLSSINPDDGIVHAFLEMLTEAEVA